MIDNNIMSATSIDSTIAQRRLFSVSLKSCFRLLQILLLLALTACATIQHDYPRTESHTLTDTNQTTLGKDLSELTSQHPDDTSGFKLLVDGVDAFALRLLLAEHAEKSIDTQYYLLTDDLIGNAFIGSLLEAADRGVRVRLLLDDIQTQGYDHGMAALDSHPNIEVRIFNPFANRGAHQCRSRARMLRISSTILLGARTRRCVPSSS